MSFGGLLGRSRSDEGVRTRELRNPTPIVVRGHLAGVEGPDIGVHDVIWDMASVGKGSHQLSHIDGCEPVRHGHPGLFAGNCCTCYRWAYTGWSSWMCCKTSKINRFSSSVKGSRARIPICGLQSGSGGLAIADPEEGGSHVGIMPTCGPLLSLSPHCEALGPLCTAGVAYVGGTIVGHL